MTKQKQLRKKRMLILVAFAFSGAAALIYEVAWTRALSLVLGSTVYALSTMLSTFMGGLAIGAFIGGRISHRSNPTFLLGLCEMGIGMTGLVSIPIIYNLPHLYAYIYKSLHLHPVLFYVFQVLVCGLVMLGPTTLMGATFPLVVKYISKNIDEVGRTTGLAYSVNTIGAVSGSLAVGFFLIPLLGVKGSTFIAAGINFAVGLTLLVSSGERKAVLTSVIAMVCYLAAGTATASVQQRESLVNFYTMYRQLDEKATQEFFEFEKKWDRYQTYYEENVHGTVFAAKIDENVFVQVGGKFEGTLPGDIPNTVLLALLPTASHQNPQTFLNIGLGAGVTLKVAKKYIEDPVLVEINPGVVHAINKLGPPGLLDGISVVYDDARNYLLKTEHKFDIIASQPSYPTESGVTNLFTREFFQIAARQLKQRGVYCQWIPYYFMSDEDVTVLLKTLSEVFPYFQLWSAPSNRDLLVVSSLSPMKFSPQEVMERVQRLDTDGYTRGFAFIASDEQMKGTLAKSRLPINTDDNPILEFSILENLRLGDLRQKKIYDN
jgi:spermidine synthase